MQTQSFPSLKIELGRPRHALVSRKLSAVEVGANTRYSADTLSRRDRVAVVRIRLWRQLDPLNGPGKTRRKLMQIVGSDSGDYRMKQGFPCLVRHRYSRALQQRSLTSLLKPRGSFYARTRLGRPAIELPGLRSLRQLPKIRHPPATLDRRHSGRALHEF